jgi:hypothetical protein
MFFSFLICTSCARKNTLLKTQDPDYTQIPETKAGLYKSIFLEKNQFIISTLRNDNGLMLYNPVNKQLTQLNDLKGAGSKFLLDQEEKNVVFITYTLVDNRRYQSILIQNIWDKKIKTITENRRNLKLLSLSSDLVMYLDNDKVLSFNTTSGKLEESPENVIIAYSDPDLNLALYLYGEKKTLNPLGPGNYIWVAISPDKKFVLYNKTGSGTYICDLNGKNILYLGNINYAQWAGEGNWVLGMNDQDDGHKFIKSDILLINARNSKTINLTESTDVIALYPSISSDLRTLVFNDENGRIFTTGLKDHKIK